MNPNLGEQPSTVIQHAGIGPHLQDYNGAGQKAFSAILNLLTDQLHIAGSFLSRIDAPSRTSTIIAAQGQIPGCVSLPGSQAHIATPLLEKLQDGTADVVAAVLIASEHEMSQLPHSCMVGSSYIAVPVVLSDGTLFGLLGGMDGAPHDFIAAHDNRLLATLARLVAAQVECDIELDARRQEGTLLRGLADLHRSFVDGARDAIFTIATDGIIVSLNPAFEAITGWVPSTWIGKPFASLIHPEDLPYAEQLYRGLMDGENGSLEVRALTRSSDYWIAEITASNHAPNGVLSAVFGIARDVTARKRIELDLQQQRLDLAREVASLEERSRQMSVLNELGDLLHTCISANEAYSVVAQFTPRLFPGGSGALLILTAESQLAEAVAVWGDNLSTSRLFKRDDCWALRRGRTHMVNDRLTGLLCHHLQQPPPHGYLCVPMMAQGDALGILYLQGAAGSSVEIASQEALALSLGEHISLALANLRIRETLSSMAIRDPLTGLFNRRYLEESLEREVRRTTRNGQPIGVIMLDVDNFKHFNDNFGHPAGDMMLNTMARLLRTRTRAGDIASRYGGEEFTLVMPEATLQSTLLKAEQIRREVKQLQVLYQSRQLGPVTLSLGVASFPEHGDTAQSLLQAADTALYSAKHNGRDRVAVAKPD